MSAKIALQRENRRKREKMRERTRKRESTIHTSFCEDEIDWFTKNIKKEIYEFNTLYTH